jgi:hypothetical protein
MNTDWRKRDTPTPMLLAVALLVVYAIGALLIGLAEKSWIIGGAALAAAVAAYGAATLKPWSRYFVFALALGLVAKLGYSVYTARAIGYFESFDTRRAVLWTLAPSLAMTVLFLGACWIVHRQFSRWGDIGTPPA